MISSRHLVILATFSLAASPAHADVRDGAELGYKMAKGVADRTRRGIAIGPTVGYAGGFDTDGNGMQGISFGLALYTFKIPTVFDLQELVASRIKARLAAEAKELVKNGGQPPDLEELAKRIAREVRDEILGEPIKPRTFEKPSTKLVVEGTWLLKPGGFQMRTVFSKGAGPVTLGLSGAYQRANDQNVWFIGPEVGLQLTPIGQSRTPVIDLFARAELGYDRRDHGNMDALHPFVVVLGARALVDIL